MKTIALLRAINVGGHTVTMATLKSLFEALGLRSVETFIASGNVIFDADGPADAALEGRIAAHLESSLGFPVATFLRTDAELAAVAARRPFDAAAMAAAAAHNVAFLATPLAPDEVAALDRFRTDVDDFAAAGREVHWLCRRKQSESTFSNAVFERTLRRQATFRGHNTVARLAAKVAPAGAVAAALLGLIALPALAAPPRPPAAAARPGAGTAPMTAVAALAPAVAVAAQGRAPVTVTVGGNRLQWRTLPETFVTATLLTGGDLKAEVGTFSDERGRVTLSFEADDGSTVIAAGDEVRFKAEPLDEVWTVAVPPLAADVDAAADRVVGRAAPGTAVEVGVWTRPDAAIDHFDPWAGVGGGPSGVPIPPALERRATAGPDGALAVDLAGDADIAPGDHVIVTARDAGGDAYVALGAATAAYIRPGAAYGAAYATLGTTVTLDVVAPDGALRTSLRGVATHVDGDGRPAMAFLAPPEPDDDEGGGGGGGVGRVVGRAGGARDGRGGRMGVGEGEGTGTGDGGGGGGETPAVPQPGDRLVLRRDGGLLAPAVTTATLPALAVDGLDRAGGVRGRAPAGAAVRARLLGPLEERLDLAVAPRPDGTFDAQAGTPLGPGWRATLVWSDPGGVSSGVVGTMPQVRARVGATRLDGIGYPDRIVTATLRGAGGVASGPFTATAAPDGTFVIVLGDGGGPSTPARRQHLSPGTVVEVEFEPGDPVVVAVPDVTTVVDPDRERVAGGAPPGAAVVVTLRRPRYDDEDGWAYDYVIADRRPVTAGLDGRFEIDFGAAAPSGPAVDLEPPLWGDAVVVRADGHFVLRAWAPLTIDAWLESSSLSGFGPPGEAVAVTLRDGAGRVVVEHHQANDEPWQYDAPQWWTETADRFGQSVPVRAGDTVAVTVGGQSAQLVVPPLDASSHIADDRVAGRTRPSSTMALVAYGPDDQLELDLTSDADGAFAFDLGAAGFDLVYNTYVALSVDIGRHSLSHDVDIPGLTLDLDTGNVSGSSEPDAVSTLSIERAGRTIASRPVRAGPYGWFDAFVTGPDGAAVVPRPGDQIVLATPGARFIEPRVVMAVPDVTIELPPERDRLAGRHDPAGTLSVDLSSDGEAPQWPGETDLSANPDGRWRLTWDNADFRLGGGWTVSAWWTSPVGHVAARWRAVPRLDLRLGSPHACGRALPGQPVRLALTGPGGAAALATTAARDGRFYGALAAADGRPRPVRSGDRVAADLGGWADDVVVPPLDVTVDWATRRITGTTAPSTTVGLASWHGDCTADGGGLGWTPWSTRSGPTGRFGFALPDEPVGPFGDDGRFAVVVRDAGGHRVYTPLAALRVTVRPDTPAATGAGRPGGAVTATLHAADGRARAAATATVGDDGRWTLALADGSGRPVPMRDGDVLQVGVDGQVARLVVEALAFDFDVRRGLVGSARPGRSVNVVLDVVDPSQTRGIGGQYYWLEADSQGRFGIDAPPPRARWSFADVRAVRATIALTGGHQLLSTLELAPPRAAPVYLPVGFAR